MSWDDYYEPTPEEQAYDAIYDAAEWVEANAEYDAVKAEVLAQNPDLDGVDPRPDSLDRRLLRRGRGGRTRVQGSVGRGSHLGARAHARASDAPGRCADRRRPHGLATAST